MKNNNSNNNTKKNNNSNKNNKTNNKRISIIMTTLPGISKTARADGSVGGTETQV